jgi:uncharacterized repeat protein (TIGR03803 family)
VLSTGEQYLSWSKTGKEKLPYSFTGGADGANPFGGLIRDAADNFYGSALTGGDLTCFGGSGANNGCGTVFKIDSTGKQTVLHAFAGIPDGMYPIGNLIEDAKGNFYGTTGNGGGLCGIGCGTVFRVDATGKESAIYRFSGSSDGNSPRAGREESQRRRDRRLSRQPLRHHEYRRHRGPGHGIHDRPLNSRLSHRCKLRQWSVIGGQ